MGNLLFAEIKLAQRAHFSARAFLCLQVVRHYSWADNVTLEVSDKQSLCSRSNLSPGSDALDPNGKLLAKQSILPAWLFNSKIPNEHIRSRPTGCRDTIAAAQLQWRAQ